MLSNRFTSIALLAASVGALLVGCSSNGGQTDSAATTTSAASQLVAANDSLASAEAAASACFDAYKACESASGSDAKTCRDQLTACLPVDAPAPTKCDGAVGDSSGAKSKPGVSRDLDPAGAAGAGPKDETNNNDPIKAGAPKRAPDAPHADNDKVDANDPTAPMGAAGAPNHGDRDADGAAGADPGKEACNAPPIPRDKLSGCRDATDTTLAHGTDPTAAADAHQTCMKRAFGSYVTDLCQSATKLCGPSNSTTDACVSIQKSCSDASAP